MFVIDQGYAKSGRHFVRGILKLKMCENEKVTDAGDKIAGFEAIGSPKLNNVEKLSNQSKSPDRPDWENSG